MDNTIPTLAQGCVVGRILHSTGDGPDLGALTDTAVSVGFVDFTPATAYRKLSADTVVVHAKITAKLDSHGHLHPTRATSDNTGSDAEDAVWLPTGTWTVAYRLSVGTLPSHNIVVTEAHTALAPLALFTSIGDAPVAGASYQTLTLPVGGVDGQVLVLSGGSLVWADGGTGGGLTTEGVQDVVGAIVVAAGGTYDDAAGTITLPTPEGTRGLIITDANVATIPAGDVVDNLAAYYNSSSGPITVAGVAIASGSHAVWAWVSGAWVLLAAGTGGTPPTASLAAPTGLTSTPTSDGAVLSWSAVLGAAGYVVKVDSSAWMAVTETSYIATGLVAGSHSWQVAATDANGTGAARSGTFVVVAAPAGFVYTTDYFDAPTAVATIGQTATYDWVAPLGGSGWPGNLATIENGVVSAGGGSLSMPSQDVRFSILTDRASSVRLYVRGQAVMVSQSGGGWRDEIAGVNIGTNPAGVGPITATITVAGTTATFHVNDTLIGNLAIGASSGDKLGFEVIGARVYAARIEQDTTGTPTTLALRTAAAGTVITSECFTGADATTVAGRTLDGALGKVGEFRWASTASGGGWTSPALGIAANQAIRVGTGTNASWLYVPYGNLSFTGTLVALPNGGDTEVVLATFVSGGASAASLKISATAITLLTGNTSRGTLGTPQAGDIYTLTLNGATATLTGKRSGGSDIGTPVSATFTRAGAVCDVRHRPGNTAAIWDNMIWEAV